MYLKINNQNPEPKKIEKAVEVLKAGGIIIYPTDTIYGLGCDIFNKKAVEKIYRIKKREKNKPMSIICPDLKEVAKYAIIQNYAYRLMKKTLPGPYTFILKARQETPKTILAKNKTIGIRIPDNQICLDLASKLGNPIISTSLNISGEAVLTNPGKLSKEMANKIDLIIDAGVLPDIPSSIIDLSNQNPMVLREGKGDLSLFSS